MLHFKGLVIFGLLAFQAWGAEVTMTVTPPLISLNETAQVSIEVRDANQVSPPRLPKVDGLIFDRPSQSTQRRWVNGKTSRSTTYTFQVLPQKTGKFTLGPFSYTVDGKSKTLQGHLNVVSTSRETAQPQSWDELLFTKLTTTRQQAYVQEPFDLTLSIYSRTGLQTTGNINLEGMPATGLSEIAWSERPKSREKIAGQIYDVRRFHSTTRAMGSGTFVFAPTITVHVALPNQSRSRDPFGSIFQQTRTRPVQLQPEKVAVSILPLPTEQQPKPFSGAVGQFDFSVTATPLEIHPGDPITLTMTLIGKGNFDRVMPPSLPPNNEFRLFGDAVRKQGNNGVRFEQVISPRHTNTTEIPPLSFSYFDTQSKQYRTLYSQKIPITVSASENNTAQIFASQETQNRVLSDQPFASESDIQRLLGWFHQGWIKIKPWIWIFPAVLLLGLLLFAGQKLYRFRRHDTAWIRRQQAPKAAKKALRRAEKALHKKDATAFYNALWDALAVYFGNRLNLPPGEIIPSSVLDTLHHAGLSDEHLETLRTIYEQIDLARYSTASSTLHPEKTAAMKRHIETLLKQVEKVRLETAPIE